jgi:hypothetical protein
MAQPPEEEPGWQFQFYRIPGYVQASYAARKTLVFDAGFNRWLTATSTQWEAFAGCTYLLPQRLWRANGNRHAPESAP